MVDVLITSPFLLTKPESPDNTIVSTSEWNAAKLITGGAPGQVLARDGASATGATWIDGTAVQRTSENFSGSIVNTAPMAPAIISCTSNAFIFVQPYVLLVLAVGSSAVMAIRRNGTSVATGQVKADGFFYQAFSYVASEVPGTYTYDVILSGTSGAITTANVVITTIRLGRL
jgi:hypothetical protein